MRVSTGQPHVHEAVGVGLELSLLLQEDCQGVGKGDTPSFSSRLWDGKHAQEGVSYVMALEL